MSVSRARDVADTPESETLIEVIPVDVIDGLDAFLPEDSIVAASHGRGNEEAEDVLGLFPSEVSGELEYVVEAEAPHPSSTESQAVSSSVGTQAIPRAPDRYLTASRAAALLVAFCSVAGGIAITDRLRTPSVAQDEVSRSVSLPGRADAPQPAAGSQPNPHAASEDAVAPTRVPTRVDLPASATPGGRDVAAGLTRDRGLRSAPTEPYERVSRQSAPEPVTLLGSLSAPAAVREQADPGSRLLATLPAVATNGVAEVPPTAPTSPAPGRPEPPSGPVDPQPGAEDGAIEDALGRYLSALNQLDPAAVRGVWPTADVNALGRAFGQLESQQVGFDDCTIVISGAQARAECRGILRYIPRIGQKHLREEPRQWRFDLHKVSENWLIAAVAAR